MSSGFQGDPFQTVENVVHEKVYTIELNIHVTPWLYSQYVGAAPSRAVEKLLSQFRPKETQFCLF